MPFIAFKSFMPSLVEHVPHAELDRRTVDRPDLELGKQALAVLDPEQKVQAAADVAVTVLGVAFMEGPDDERGPPTEIDAPRLVLERDPVREFEVEGKQGEVVANPNLRVRSKCQMLDERRRL